MTELVYRQGKQRIQREAILETGGSHDPYEAVQNARRVEAGYVVARAEEVAKKSPGLPIVFVCLGHEYTVSLE